MNGRNQLYDGKPVRVGDRVVRRPVSFSGDACYKAPKLMSGTVVYVHPKGRYHTVRFDNSLKESFLGVGLPRRFSFE